MSEWWSIFSSSDESTDDAFTGASSRGQDAMREFHNYSLQRFPATYRYTFPEMYRAAMAKAPTVASSLGRVIISEEMSDTRVREGMRRLADATQGALPADPNAWPAALTEAANHTVLTDAVDNVREGLSVVGHAVESGYESTISGAKTVIGDAVGIATTPITSLFENAGGYILIGIAVIGALIYVAGKSGAVKIDRVA